MLRANLIFDFSVVYANTHPELERGFDVGEPLLGEFRSYLREREFEFENGEFTENSEVIKLRLRAQIARVKWDQIEESRVLAQADPQIRRALELFGEAADLSARGADGEPGRKAPDELRAEIVLDQ
jgi:hypothetical protein